MRFASILFLFLCWTHSTFAQDALKVACIAFYNFENLFDTLDSPDTDDLEFTPNGTNLYNSRVYYDKLDRLARVVSEIGTNSTPDGPAILGVAEIENMTVLQDFVNHPAIAHRGYKIIHKDSKDARGIDVALLYQPKYFTPTDVEFYSLMTDTDSDFPRYSRDILLATGILDGESIAVSVNHWPSRRGGEQTTAHLRIKAALKNKEFIEGLASEKGITKVVVMGDLNDDPINDSVKKVFNTNRSTKDLADFQMFNPYEEYYRKGKGTTAYQDAWSLFDQIILSYDLTKDKKGFHFHSAEIHNPSYLTQKSGKFKGYPLRAFSNGAYIHGYSDHFPVYVLLVKPMS